MKRRRRHAFALFLSGLLALFLLSTANATTSELWGNSGEKWSTTSRLPDFSKAGYEAGLTAIPDPPVTINVKDEGAVGDGTTDDSNAFLKAISLTTNGVIYIPAGRYLITRQLKITNSDVVLRGAGLSATTLYFPKSLEQVVGSSVTEAPGGSWSWSGGFIYAKGQDLGGRITSVTAAATRGDNTLIVSSAAGLTAGLPIRLVMTDSEGTLGRLLLGNQTNAPSDMTGIVLVDFPATIQSVSGNRVTLNRSLPLNVSTSWSPTLYAMRPSVHDVGIEDLTIEFPPTQYAGHFLEPGFNAIDFDGVSDSWIRRIKIINADSGIFFRVGTRRCTVQSVHWMAVASRLRTGYTPADPSNKVVVGGHHGFLTDGLVTDNLVTNLQFDFRFIHDLAVSAYSTGNVFSDVQGYDMDLDQHRRAPYENLFTNIDAGLGTRLWESGGDTFEGPPCGLYETFWNIRAQQPEGPPPWALQTTLVGWTTASTGLLMQTPNWLEAIAPGSLTPPDIYLAEKGAVLPPPSSTNPPPVTLATSPALTIRVYPNPWRADLHHDHPITFDDLPPMSTIKLYTVSGHLVKTLLGSGTQILWDLTNDSGQTVASGIYLYLLTSAHDQKTEGKLAIIR